MQTIWPLLRHRQNRADSDIPKSSKRPAVLDTCHAWASDSEVVKENAPDFYTGEDKGSKAP
ncbi:MAG: hypothetical protein MRY76_14195, partial [Pseudomonadales bacterium]|nr:hypothetical protein [Pseudomonadales bacterium]